MTLERTEKIVAIVVAAVATIVAIVFISNFLIQEIQKETIFDRTVILQGRVGATFDLESGQYSIQIDSDDDLRIEFIGGLLRVYMTEDSA